LVVCDGDSTVGEIDAATYYRDSRGAVSEITYREKRCSICGGTTLVRCANGVTRTFTIAHAIKGCVEKVLDVSAARRRGQDG
jgi:hypothetical protein